MEPLHHKNHIEIRLLPNRRFIYANRRQSIVITAEHLATEICVLFPDEYEDYSKRVDFVNSQGKEWTEALFVPEYKKYKPGFHKTRFHFLLPTEVTSEGELKMQFIAYLPDESMTTVPFEIIPIDVQSGILAFKKNARSNPDLLILSYNRSTEALFKAEQAKAKALSAQESAQSVVDRADNGAFNGEKGDKGETGEKGDKGDKGDDGVLLAVDSLIGLYVDPDGNFYAYAGETSGIDFRYDEDTGNCYILFS
ncbi:MAG: hypothetical protein FWD58_08405 [Firmicutes bacterium]|nr:hypothetical protein [Bacillota bacterium]